MKRFFYILLGASLLLTCLTTSCTERVVYMYDDIVITRYDGWGYNKGKLGWSHSDYYCNKSDLRNYIRVVGAQNYYSAYLLIDKQTDKVWIAHEDCLITQKHIDYNHFQGDVYDVSTHDYSLHYIRDSLTSKYECYYLCAYTNREPEMNQDYFPNTRIQAKYSRASFGNFVEEKKLAVSYYIRLLKNKKMKK